jgi:alpha-glucosidase
VTVLIFQYQIVLGKEIGQLLSPDKRISVEILQHDKLYYRVKYQGQELMQAVPVAVTINGVQRNYVHATANLVFGSQDTLLTNSWGVRKVIRDHYNFLTIRIDKELSLQFRAYDNGIAYRFVLQASGKEYVVDHEEVAYRFNFQTKAWLLQGQSYESNYIERPLDVLAITDFNNSMHKIYLPMVVQANPGVKVAITEAGLYNYPSLFLDRGNDYENFLNGSFEKYSTVNKVGGFSNYSELSGQQASYIAKIPGQFEFPWRLMVVAPEDAVLADCDLVYQLSRPSAIGTADWVKPGKVAWDWWHDYVVKGQPFKGGINTQTYLHYIDFAAKHGLEYIIVDWLWTDKYDLTLFNPEVDIRKIIAYGKQKKVDVVLWCPGHTLYRQLDKALDLFASIGAAGIKADFFGREDQTGMRMYEEIAAAAARRKLLVDFHGCAKPTGLHRTYPNVINYEAVLGNEYNKLKLDPKATVAHKVMLAFTRALQGPMDYTPGGMRNAHPEGYAIFFNQPMVMGTRSNEMALFVLYHEPLKMLCDAPAAYEQEPEVLDLIKRIPTVWDETKVLKASYGEYVVIARRKGRDWYVAGITDNHERRIDVNLGFLEENRYALHMMQDGVNADRIATDYHMVKKQVAKDHAEQIVMVKGGGFLMHLAPLD